MTPGPGTGRVEDRRLLAGAGTGVADLAADGLEAAFVRSPVAHAVLDDVVVDRGLALPGEGIRRAAIRAAGRRPDQPT